MGNPVVPVSEHPVGTMALQKYLIDEGWEIVNWLKIDSRPAKYFDYNDYTRGRFFWITQGDGSFVLFFLTLL